MNKRETTLVTIVGVIAILFVSSFSNVTAESTERWNGLTIALDTLRSSDTPQTIINFMKQYNYNALRIYMGWCGSFWTGNVNAPMNSATQNFIDELCRLAAQNNFMVVCAVSMQVTPFKTAFPGEMQVGPNGEQNSQGNWVDPTGPNFQTFTKNLIRILTRIMEKYATPRISVDEIVFVTAGGKPAFYSQSMRTLYQQRTGKNIPIFTSTSGSYNTEQRQFIEFAKGTIRDFYAMMRDTAKAENPNTLFQALLDTYWVYPKTSYDTQPWDYYATTNFDELAYEWFYAIQDGNWAGITDGLQRIRQLNPTAKLYFIYGTSTMTTVTNMRRAVQLAMSQNYTGVFLYEYAKSRSSPFDVSDIVKPMSPKPTPSPSPGSNPTQNLFEDSFESKSFSLWSGTTTSSSDTVTIANYRPYDGTYHARFSTSGISSGRENAYLSKSIDLSNVYARGYFQFVSTGSYSSSILRDNGDRFYLIQFTNADGTLASAGVRREGGVDRWLLYANGRYQVSAQAVSKNQYYSVELHLDEAQGIVELYINGARILQMTIGNSNSNVSRINFGIVYATNVQNQLLVYGDCFAISNRYIGPEA